ncbi:hypothetical protein [Bovine papular stomatitis virus]
MAGIRSCQKRNVTAAPPFQKPLKIKSSGFQHSDFDFNPRPPPPTQDEIDTFCVDMRTALADAESAPRQSQSPSKYPDIILPVESAGADSPPTKKKPPSRPRTPKHPSPNIARRDGFSRWHDTASRNPLIHSRTAAMIARTMTIITHIISK